MRERREVHLARAGQQRRGARSDQQIVAAPKAVVSYGLVERQVRELLNQPAIRPQVSRNGARKPLRGPRPEVRGPQRDESLYLLLEPVLRERQAGEDSAHAVSHDLDGLALGHLDHLLQIGPELLDS